MTDARIDTHRTLDPESVTWLEDHFDDVDMEDREWLEEMFQAINIIETHQLVKPQANRLERHIVNWINEQAADSYPYRSPDSIQSVINDLRKGGCSSGFVSHLLYYKDSTPFFDKFEAEITEVINEYVDSTLDNSVILGNNDGFHLTQLKQRLSWTAFELVANRIAEEAGL